MVQSSYLKCRVRFSLTLNSRVLGGTDGGLLLGCSSSSVVVLRESSDDSVDLLELRTSVLRLIDT
jgi:hypothetical protein